MSTLKLCLAQLSSHFGNKALNEKRILQSMKKAVESGADYIVFPEMYYTGPSIDEQLDSLAITHPENELSVIMEEAKELGVGVILGLPQKKDGKLYNTAIFIDKLGCIKQTYHKIHLPGYERTVFTPGNECPVIQTPEATFGLMISYDIEFPEVARILTIKGAQIIVALSAHKHSYQRYQDIYLTSRAMENHVFVTNVNLVGLNEQTIYLGESSVIHPEGYTLSKSSSDDELSVVEIDLTEIAKASQPLNYLENRRPHIYKQDDVYQAKLK